MLFFMESDGKVEITVFVFIKIDINRRRWEIPSIWIYPQKRNVNVDSGNQQQNKRLNR